MKGSNISSQAAAGSSFSCKACRTDGGLHFLHGATSFYHSSTSPPYELVRHTEQCNTGPDICHLHLSGKRNHHNWCANTGAKRLQTFSAASGSWIPRDQEPLKEHSRVFMVGTTWLTEKEPGHHLNWGYMVFCSSQRSYFALFADTPCLSARQAGDDQKGQCGGFCLLKHPIL